MYQGKYKVQLGIPLFQGAPNNFVKKKNSEIPIFIHLVATPYLKLLWFNPFMPTVAFNICCPRDCVSRHNGGTSGAPLKPLGDNSAPRALSSLRGLGGAPEVPPFC